MNDSNKKNDQNDNLKEQDTHTNDNKVNANHKKNSTKFKVLIFLLLIVAVGVYYCYYRFMQVESQFNTKLRNLENNVNQQYKEKIISQEKLVKTLENKLITLQDNITKLDASSISTNISNNTVNGKIILYQLIDIINIANQSLLVYHDINASIKLLSLALDIINNKSNNTNLLEYTNLKIAISSDLNNLNTSYKIDIVDIMSKLDILLAKVPVLLSNNEAHSQNNVSTKYIKVTMEHKPDININTIKSSSIPTKEAPLNTESNTWHAKILDYFNKTKVVFYSFWKNLFVDFNIVVNNPSNKKSNNTINNDNTSLKKSINITTIDSNILQQELKLAILNVKIALMMQNQETWINSLNYLYEYVNTHIVDSLEKTLVLKLINNLKQVKLIDNTQINIDKTIKALNQLVGVYNK